jgi:2,4-dienoyl-CoA reductase-like NADH-dependent reductase (Old Yellow Enzyme family)
MMESNASSHGAARLFTPISFGTLKLANRIVIAPMCQYSAVDGNAVHWHLVHLGSLAISGAGLLILEATAVSAQGRITEGCLGLYNDENQAALRGVVDALRSVSGIPLAIQLGHAGRKAPMRKPWEGGAPMAPEDGGWETMAPSAIPHLPGQAPPREMSAGDIRKVVACYAGAAARAREIGFDAIELHMAHGYLLHQFLSPVSNKRTDRYGGSFENRMRFPLEVFRAVAEAAGPDMPVGVRLSGTDWVEGGWDIGQTVQAGVALEALGCAFLDISSGGVSVDQKVTAQVGPGYQVPMAAAVKRAVNIPVIGVGLITEPRHAEDILARDDADAIGIARGMLHDPRWPWRAAADLGARIPVAPPLLRALPRGHAPIFSNG